MTDLDEYIIAPCLIKRLKFAYNKPWNLSEEVIFL